LAESPDAANRLTPPSLAERRSPVANSLFDVVGFLYPLVLTIVLTPVILHFIGTEEYGIFALAMVFVTFLGLIDFGMGPVVGRFLAASLATSDYAEARSVLGTGIVVYSAVGLVGASAAAAFGIFVVPRILSLSPELDDTAAFVMSVAGLGFLVSALLNPVGAIPGALQRFDVVATARVVSTSLGAVASVLVLWLGFGVRGLITVTVMQSALMLILVARARRLLPAVPLRPAWQPAVLRKMISFSGYSFVSNLAGSLLFQVDKFVLGALTNVSVVTYYVVPGNLAQRLHTGVARLTGVALPVSTDLHARGEKEALRTFYLRATRVVALVNVSFAVPAFIFAREILLEWVGPEFATTSFGTMRLLILTYVALSLTALPYYFTLGVGRPQVSAGFNVATAVINVVLIVILIPPFGLVGAAVAYLASTVTVPFLIVYVERRLLELDSSPWPSLLARLSLVATGQAIACLLLRPHPDGLLQLLGVLILAVAIAPMLAVVTGYVTPQDRATVKRLVPVRRLHTSDGRVAHHGSSGRR
jgi:O-antigen/teichoic acid export membrane protein